MVSGFLVRKAFQSPLNVAGHGNVKGAVFVVPLKGEADVSGAGPVKGGFVLLLKGADEAGNIVGIGVTDTKVVGDQGEHEIGVQVLP